MDEIMESKSNNMRYSDGKHISGFMYTLFSRSSGFVISKDNSVISETSYAEIIQGPQTENSQNLMIIKFPEGDLYFYIESIGNNTQYFINGESYTKEQLHKELNLFVD